MVSCPVVVVVMLVRGVHCDEDVAKATSSSQCTHLTSITTTTGQETIGSETHSDLLTMSVKTLETC
jgi:hypothetical protein